MIRSRFLRHRITLNDVTETENDFGEKRSIETPAFRISCEVEDSEVSQFSVAEGDSIDSAKRFRVRFNRRIQPNMTVTFKGQTYEISSIENVKELNREMIINAVRYND